MGCLKFIIKAAIVVLAIIGFKSLGGIDWVMNNIPSFEKPTQEAMMEKTKDVADFSKIPDEYEISKSANVLGYRAVVAEHDATGQKMAVVNQNKNINLTKKDFKDGTLEKKINELTQKLSYQYIHVKNFKITKQGTMKTMGQTVPYATFEAEVTNLPIKEIKGIISVAENKDEKGKDKIILSANQSDKYSQIITEQFFKKVDFNEPQE